MSKFALVYVLYYAIMVSCGVAENLSETFVAGLDDRTKCCLDSMPFHGKISRPAISRSQCWLTTFVVEILASFRFMSSMLSVNMEGPLQEQASSAAIPLLEHWRRTTILSA